jgi:hypothetical protein
MAYKQRSPIPILEGGTNAQSFTTSNAVVIYDGTRLVSVVAGTSGYVLTSNGPGVDPSWQNIQANGAVTALQSDSGTATPTLGIIDIDGGSNINTSATGSTLTVNLDSSINVPGSVIVGNSLTVTGGFVSQGLGIVNISADANTNTVNVATGSGVKTLTIGSTNTTSSVTINTGSGGINVPSFSTAGAVVTTSAGLLSDANASTAGFVLTSNGAGSPPSFQAAGGGGMTWTEETGATLALAVNNGYILNRGTAITATLPASAAVGDIIGIVGSGSGGWIIAQNSGQTIHFGNQNTTTGAGGSLASTNRYDCLEIICNVTDTDFVVRSSMGNITFV